MAEKVKRCCWICQYYKIKGFLEDGECIMGQDIDGYPHEFVCEHFSLWHALKPPKERDEREGKKMLLDL